MVERLVNGTDNTSKAPKDLSDILDRPAIDHIQRIADEFLVFHDEMERYVIYMNHKTEGITVGELLEDLVYTWPPTTPNQDY
ncbi:hypothetical protein X943_003148 [Babesia divergens]|uniref:Uncharacterized protein n=1 Tax=Babesia divergens TaxID=32595 RepID=A0AAD9GHM8_BABDI|nr:hypothetical protein X943_003148 [Babesia divergens]